MRAAGRMLGFGFAWYQLDALGRINMPRSDISRQPFGLSRVILPSKISGVDVIR